MFGTLLFSLTSCSNPPVIEGRVLDIWDKPISNSMVKMEGEVEAQHTDSNGNFSFIAKDGSMRFRAGHENYIHDVEVAVYSSTDTDLPPKVTFNLYPKPEENGFYAIGAESYEQIVGQKIQQLETQLQSIKGIKDLGEIQLTQEQANGFVFFSTLRKEQIKQFKLQLHPLTFTETIQIKSLMGVTDTDVHMYTVSNTMPIDFELLSLDQEYMYLLKPKENLPLGYYAFHDSEILTNDETNSLNNHPPELNLAYSFEVK